jgi:hypothetical protein
VGQVVEVTVPYTITAALNGDTVTVGMSITSKPSTSSASETSTYFTTSTNALAAIVPNATTGSTYDLAASTNNANKNQITRVITTAGNIATYPLTESPKFKFTPDKAGTYIFAYYLDADNSANVSSGDTVKYISVTAVDSGASTVSISKPIDTDYATYNSTYGTTAGVWVKLQVKDAAGANYRPNASEVVALTMPTGLTLAADGATPTSVTAGDYYLAAASFDTAGVAWVNFTASTAGTYTLSAKVAGATAVSTTSLKFVAADTYATVQVTGFKNPAGTAVAATPVIGNNGSVSISNATTATAPSTSTSQALKVNSATASGVVGVRITDSNSDTLLTKIFGAKNRFMDIAVTAGDTAKASTDTTGSASLYVGTFSVPATLGITSDLSYKAIIVNSWTSAATTGSTLTITGAATSVGALSLTSPASSTILVAPAATVSTTVRCKDVFGAGKATVTLTPTISGRNATLAIGSVVTDSSGYATFSYKDASTSTTSLQDTITFAGCSTATALLTVNYTSTTDLGVSKIAWSAGGGFADSTSYVGFNTTAISAGDDPSTNSPVAVSFKVTDAAGSPITGVPVTFTLSGLASSAIVKTATVDNATVYTASTGVASTSVFAWAPGTLTVTATAAGKTATGYVTFVSAAASAARVLTGTYNNGVISLKVVDRFGNGVKAVTVDLSRTGTGFFGDGKSVTTALTGTDGTVDVAFNGDATVKASLAYASYPQAYDVADKIAATALTAALAGTTTGTGASLAPTGVNAVTFATTSGSDVTTAAAQSAADAAAEATDAANAATDAANAAAEAADAATAAAQDAADAVAALSTQVSEMIDALKKQITALTNLVIKIQKKVKA